MKIKTYIYSMIAIAFIGGCGSVDNPPSTQMDGGELVVDLDGKFIKKSLLDNHVAGITEDTVVYGQKAYKIPYVTTDEEGNEVNASGYMVVPTGLPQELIALKGLSVVSDDHGTIFNNNEALSVIASTTNSPSGASIILTSLAGFVTLEPDYIGFGDSVGHYHPFVMKKSLANATVDFIKAAREFAKNNDINLNDQLFLTGYSEGGYAALATLQKIEQEHIDMPVTLATPMAGPYDLNLTAFGVLAQPTLVEPSFMADVAYAYAKAYDREYDEIINEPYASRLPTLFDGSKYMEEIDAELTDITTGEDGLFSPVFVYDFVNNPDNWFRKAMVENSLHRWAPQTSIRLIQCRGDEVIPYQMSEWTKANLDAYGGVDIQVIPVEDALGIPVEVQHSACGVLAYSLTSQIFATIRQSTIGY
jgi:pimeloyl-ACP methyl ester carboxylesterase